jgi:hypothetical protein
MPNRPKHENEESCGGQWQKRATESWLGRIVASQLQIQYFGRLSVTRWAEKLLNLVAFWTGPIQRFYRGEKAGGVTLVVKPRSSNQ